MKAERGVGADRMAVLDRTDLKILSVLLRNSRTPYSQMARMLNLGESTIYTRVKRLVEEGILLGFTVDLDLSRLGLVTQAFVEIKPDFRRFNELVRHLESLPWVVEIYKVSGDYPILVRVVARSNEELSTEIDAIYSLGYVKELSVKYVIEAVIRRSEGKVISRLLEQVG